MNQMNARSQNDPTELVVPLNMIDSVEFGQMLFFAKTVDCAFLGQKLRFRCNGKNNDRLFEAITSLKSQA